MVSKVLDITSKLILLSSDNHTARNILARNVRKLLHELAAMFERIVKYAFKAEPITQRMIEILSSLSGFMAEPEDAARMLKLLHTLCRKPARIVPEKVKTNLLRITSHLTTLLPAATPAAIRTPSASIHSPVPVLTDPHCARGTSFRVPELGLS